MAAFIHEEPSNRAHFDAHWTKLMSRDSILKRSIEHEDALVVHIMIFDILDEQDQPVREVTNWIDYRFGGKGIASEGIRRFIDVESRRLPYGRAAKDNIVSIRSMEKWGSVLEAEEYGFAYTRGEEVAEVVMVLA